MEDQTFSSEIENVSGQENTGQEPEILEAGSDSASQTVPLAALIEERRKYQKQLEEEKSTRQKYESILSALGQDVSAQNQNLALIKSQYENILKTQGEAAANLWLNNQLGNQNLAVQAENQTILQQVQEQYKDIYAVPEVKQAIDAYLKLDMDPRRSLKEQGFPEAVEYISSIYKAGYNSALRLKSQNDAAKSRMGSSIMSGVPSGSSGKIFTRAEISAMDPETFMQNEKAIFEQMAKGLIK